MVRIGLSACAVILYFAGSCLAGIPHLDDSLGLVFNDGAGNTLPYRLFLPPGHDEPGREFPLVLFLHGAGERGTDNLTQVSLYIDGLIEITQSEPFAAFLLAPQAPPGQGWSNFGSPEPASAMNLTLQVIDELEKQYKIDPARLYVTGLSMGGYGTWDVISKFPDKFAAAVPMSGGGDLAEAAHVRGVPIWAFHGRRDSIVPPLASRAMISAVMDAGGSPLYTETGGQHDIWDAIYRDPNGELYQWMFQGVEPPLATLTYNMTNGNVKLDPSSAPGGRISAFRLASNMAFSVPETMTVNGVTVNTSVFLSTANESNLRFTATPAGAFRGIADLGSILPPGLDFVSLASLFTFQTYSSPATGGEVRFFRYVIVVPEPATGTIGLLGAGLLLFFPLRRNSWKRPA